MKTVFMGTPEFALEALKALRRHHDVVCVYSQAPKPSGRGQKLTKSPVHQYAEEAGIETRTPLSLKSPEEQESFKKIEADAAVVCAYGMLLPKACLDAFKHGAINIHGSLLPRWRGAAPIQRAIQAGDSETGVTIMQMDQGLDTGDMLLKQKIEIAPKMTSQMLHDEMMAVGAGLLIKALEMLEKNKLRPEKQPELGVTYASKITKEEGLIDWSKSAAAIERQIRAFNSWFLHEGERVFVLDSDNVTLLQNEKKLPAGTVLNGSEVVCGDGVLKLKALKRAGKSALAIDEFLRGYSLGERL